MRVLLIPGHHPRGVKLKIIKKHPAGGQLTFCNTGLDSTLNIQTLVQTPQYPWRPAGYSVVREELSIAVGGAPKSLTDKPGFRNV